MDKLTPSLVLYSDLKCFGRITYHDAARQLLSARPTYGGIAPRDRVSEKTFLSREIVRAAPGNLPESFFADFGTSTQNLVASMVSKIKHELACAPEATRDTGGLTSAAIAYARVRDHYLGEAARAMEGALRSCGEDDVLYANVIGSLAGMRLAREEDRAVLALMMFVATGCLGAPAHAAQHVEAFMRNTLALSFRTIDLASSEGDGGDPDAATRPAVTALGLARLVGGAMRPQIYRLSTDAEGSVVGSMATGPGSVSDVGPTASRRHLRIWLDAAAGMWLCEGLGSTNGSYLTRASGEIVPIEPPRSRRAGFVSTPVELRAGDRLQLGADTTFAVFPIAAE